MIAITSPPACRVRSDPAARVNDADLVAAVWGPPPRREKSRHRSPTVRARSVLLVGVRVQPASSQLTTGLDVDLRIARPRRQLRRAPWAILGVISVGGALGAVCRYGLTVAWPHRPGQFPWATFVTNVSGCLLIGVLMVLITEVWSAHRLLRPFLGVGVLGGFTTFSTYTIDIHQLVAAGVARTGLAYLAGTLASALAAVYTGITLTRLATRTHPRRKEKR